MILKEISQRYKMIQPRKKVIVVIGEEYQHNINLLKLKYNFNEMRSNFKAKPNRFEFKHTGLEYTINEIFKTTGRTKKNSKKINKREALKALKEISSNIKEKFGKEVFIDIEDTILENSIEDIIDSINAEKNFTVESYRSIEKFFSENKIENVLYSVESTDYIIYNEIIESYIKEKSTCIDDIYNFKIDYVLESPDVVLSDIKNFMNKLIFGNKPLDIYYMGLHWNECIKNTFPAGFKYVFSFINKNNLDARILFKEKTIISLNYAGFEEWPDYENDKEVLCKKIDNDTWQLIKIKE